MSLIQIPVGLSIPHQTQTTTLDGRPFRLTLDWIQRIGRWAFSLETASGVAIVRCKGLAVKADSLRQVRYRPECPQGYLTLVDLRGEDAEAGLDTLGVRHQIWYFGLDE